MGATSSIAANNPSVSLSMDHQAPTGNEHQIPLPFPKDGVRLSAILAFFELCGGRSALVDLTTTEVCENFVKPMTECWKVSFCEKLRLENHDAVGTATAFISHA